MKKYLALIMAIVIFSISADTFAANQTISYSDSASRVTSLGLMDSAENGSFDSNSITTREQFAKAIVIAAGLGDVANTMKGSTVFSDVASNGENNGYINEAINKGFITGMVDGKFHPNEGINFAQVCTAMVKVLGYTDQDVIGTWPKNYIEKAKALGLTTGLTFSNYAKVPKWAMAVMLDNLLDTNIKKANTTDADKTLAEASELTASTMYTVYSKPEIFSKSKIVNSKLGSIDFSGNPSIVRNTVDNSTNPVTTTTGEAIKGEDIKENDVVYQVSDKSGKNRYILVIDNKISGVITGISPNKHTPTQISIDGKSYDLDKSFNVSKLSSSANSFGIDDYVTLLMGYDGKVIDIIYAGGSDNSNYAFVVNYTSTASSDYANYGKKQYIVKLLLTDGSLNSYDIYADPSGFKGKLVQFTKADDGSVSLKEITYQAPGEVVINKDERLIYYNYSPNNNYITNNIKIFNITSLDVGTADVQVNLINWSDMMSGTIYSGRIVHLNKTGDFEDVNLILTRDLVDSTSRLGLVKTCQSGMQSGKKTINSTILIDGKEYTYNGLCDISDIYAGSVVRVSFYNGGINSILSLQSPTSTSTYVEAIDKNRVRINNTTNKFKSNMTIYYQEKSGDIKTVSANDIKTSNLYTKVEVYLDKPATSDGTVEILFIKELYN